MTVKFITEFKDDSHGLTKFNEKYGVCSKEELGILTKFSSLILKA